MLDEPEHTIAFPVMLPGVDGAEVMVTVSDCADDEPQELFAVTVILPPNEPAVALMVLDVEVPDHPDGSVHV